MRRGWKGRSAECLGIDTRRYQLTSFLKELKIDSAAQSLAFADLERTETAVIPNVLLTMADLRQHWPIQFPEKSPV